MSIDFARSKYKNWIFYAYKRVVRVPFCLLIAPLVRWQPRAAGESGYSVVIACNIKLKELLYVILELISRQDRTNLKELMVAFEVTEKQLDPAFRAELLRRFPDLPITFVTYNPLQSLVARAIDWPWLYAWISWCLAIGRVRTRHLLIHDFDALPIRTNFYEERYETIRRLGVTFLGVNEYNVNGFREGDGLATTWELIFDADEVRRRFRPIELFNRVGRHKDRLVEFDTTLWAQTVARSTEIMPVTVPDDLVHLGQVISQHTEFMNGRCGKGDNILFIPYMLFAAGHGELLAATTAEFERGTWPRIRYLGRTLDLSSLRHDRVDWIARLAECAEMALVGQVRPEVRAFLDALRSFSEQTIPRLESVRV